MNRIRESGSSPAHVLSVNGSAEPSHRHLLPHSPHPSAPSLFLSNPQPLVVRAIGTSSAVVCFQDTIYRTDTPTCLTALGTWLSRLRKPRPGQMLRPIYFRASAHSHMTPHPSPHGPSSRVFHPSCSRDPAAASVPHRLCHFILFESPQTFPFKIHPGTWLEPKLSS